MYDTVQSVERAVALLGQIAARPDGLSGLARRAAIPTSTAGRILATLERAETIVRDPSGDYRIGPAVVAMARSAGSAAPPLELAARPHLGSLADTTGEAAGLCVPLGDAISCVAQVDAPKPVQAEDWTGRTWPLDQGGSGLVVLASLASADRDRYLDRHPDVDRATLIDRLGRVADRGVSWSHGDYREGLSSVAAPVVDHRDRAVGALYVYGPSYRFPGTDDDADRLERLLIEHARSLSATIGAAA